MNLSRISGSEPTKPRCTRTRHTNIHTLRTRIANDEATTITDYGRKFSPNVCAAFLFTLKCLFGAVS